MTTWSVSISHSQSHSVALVVMIGVFQLLFAVLRLGRLTRFVSYSVMVGFVCGIAVRTILTQLDTISGFQSAGGNHVSKAIDLLINVRQFDAATVGSAVLAAVLIKLTSKGPIFFRQERTGQDGATFKLIKFRTMRPDAEKDSGPVWAQANDSRITKIGRLLRLSRIDEIPQFLNILRGDMSFVGPRPERPFFVQQFKHRIPQYMLRHKVKAGITGWAQVNGWRGNTSLEKRIEYDLYYIENWSVTLDIKIMWLTLIRVFAPNRA